MSYKYRNQLIDLNRKLIEWFLYDDSIDFEVLKLKRC